LEQVEQETHLQLAHPREVTVVILKEPLTILLVVEVELLQLAQTQLQQLEVTEALEQLLQLLVPRLHTLVEVEDLLTTVELLELVEPEAEVTPEQPRLQLPSMDQPVA
jgi:hypothetical protein